ncbi:MAG: hypothetical protein M5U11_12560 [Anaerolineales bacterium]|jgi:hypothetical protein|nr:hypothetical protein [candidate division KSB1 bacterium]MCZ7549960.1 hypothetical protein [Anaerolineales bacterium]MDX9937362.1 hypothetical protein [Anaerolineales bacterium]WKZ55985.1 MAG: hypothetical protein QY324_08095 [Anaerolineales bacterium]GER80594.1 conserved hypothetical protein [Candidatus Denitrolinea symbiosum]
MADRIAHYGSAIGEAIGSEMQDALNELIEVLANERGYHFLSTSPVKGRKRLLLFDNFGNDYNIDAVLVNQQTQPLILFEWKYIRYKKHNRDKASWVCSAHPAIRRHYGSIRSSIAVLAGSWSSSSLAMMKSSHINFFVIPFDRICEILDGFGVDFRWDEKDRQKSAIAWKTFNALSNSKKAQIGVEMVNTIKDDLINLVLSILDDTTERQVETVILEFRSNLGEVSEYKFNTIDEALEFLNTNELKDIFIVGDSPTLFDPRPVFDDDDAK